LQNSDQTSKYVPPSLKRNQKIEEKQEKKINPKIVIEEKIEKQNY
jgi:hypothetical protein